ncbi:metalloregulator ArsR/SmtB family transcription factor [Allorhizobium pseudoryzae]|jgi:DNA-binding transcriptional ArsR family regulator|uniref:ArsR/SmtB family transcription factor n=1 Tax=Allorhizobium pseudoryzae TaxID=379684 RepID=UPI0013EA7040|nr:metalloregulator ArsR/SmtB family transcription factor [Allorhizobium pseudoryzae]
MTPRLPLEMMQERSAEAAEFMRLFSTPTRLMLLCYIAGGERSVGDIQDELGLKQPALSQQLAELRTAGVVKTRRESRQIFYSVADDRVSAVMQTLFALFCPPDVQKQVVTSETSMRVASTGLGSAAAEAGESAQWARLDPV